MQTPPIKIKKLFADAVTPKRANITDSGLDVCVYRFEKIFSETGVWDKPYDKKSLVLKPLDRVLIDTGLTGTVGPGYEIQVRPRSGNALKKGLIVVNSPGTIDEAYRGMIGIIIANIGHEDQEIFLGERIAQLVVCPVILSEVVEVESLDDTTSRGTGGFGSSGL